MADEMTFFSAFLSYSKINSKTAESFKRQLEEYGVRVFIDTEQLHGGSELGSTLKKGIRKTTTFIPLLTEDFKKSTYANWEAETADKMGKYIISICLVDFKRYGLFKKYMGYTAKPERTRFAEYDISYKIVECVVEDMIKNLPDGIDSTPYLVGCFTKSPYVRGGNFFSKHLAERDEFSYDQINEIVETYIKHKGMKRFWTARPIIRTIMRANKPKIAVGLLADPFMRDLDDEGKDGEKIHLSSAEPDGPPV